MYRNARYSATGKRRAFISIGKSAQNCRSENSMPTLSPEEWQAISPYLDQALALSEDERAVWLRSLGEQSPALVAQLAELLDDHRVLVQEGFLEKARFGLPNFPGLAGQKLGPYTLISQIGQGGMGSVWLAGRSDGRFERRVAVKFLNLALVSRSNEERFKREGSILGRLAHPPIAELVDGGYTRYSRRQSPC